jgi:ferredoxin
LYAGLVRRGFEVLGPAIRDGTIVYDRLEALERLPAGFRNRTGPGTCRLEPREDSSLFGHVVGPRSVKSFLHPAEFRLLEAGRNGGTFQVERNHPPAARLAFFGVRPCDLAALARLDRVLLQDRYADPIYKARREPLFLVAVDCTEPAGTCFCQSMGTGPGAADGFDIALTEIRDGGRDVYLARSASRAGAELLAEAESRPAAPELVEAAAEAIRQAAAGQQRRIELRGLKEALYDAFEHPEWEAVAQRCLNCANCTMVCPTCFCVSFEDTSDISGARAERWRRWDSCFTQGFSYIHGGSVRQSPRSRYRQWMTHKLAAWQDQFGAAGCVGCGRCITWCPAGIDITEEAAVIRVPANGRPAHD